ncbi:hypothetical protein F511_34454 [Dorcoceras hygrometricum]|uniref:Splicing factor 3B subunit 1-like n=1 Tax=Dorcoceras hygrometricum TaxID=472368 RepID=A0A2Z7BWN2_9LAMI|nr:hypothetical protein F511_34454 [Dorcoceras hygrometricum]
MAASLIQNAIQVYFDSVLSMEDEGMVKMFKALESSGLCGFLGFSSTIYEADLVSFYQNASVKDNIVITSVHGKYIEISEEHFSGIFELPTEELTDMNEVPKDLVFDAGSAFSANVTIKAGSFDMVTHERFLLMAAIHGGIKINWSRILFNILKDMVAPSSKQARGFTVQICILLKGAPDLDLGESKAFPPLKILTAKTVGTYVAKNKNIIAEEEVAELVEKGVKNAATKRRPAPAVVEPAANKKRTTVRRAAPTEKNLAVVPVAQDVEPISVISAESPSARRRGNRGNSRKEPTVEEAVEDIVAKVIAETAEIAEVETYLEEPVVMRTTEMEPVETESRIDVSAITNYDAVTSFKVLSNEEGPLVETEKDKEKDTEKEATDKRKTNEKVTDFEDTEPLSKVLELTKTSLYDEESMSIDDILRQIPKDLMLPSVMAEEPTNIRFGRGIAFREVNCLWNLSVLKSVSDIANKEEHVLQWAEIDSLQTAVQRRGYITAKFSSHITGISTEANETAQSGVDTAFDLKSLWRSYSSSSGPLIDFTNDIPQTPPTDDTPRIEETTIVIPQIEVPPVVIPSTDLTEDIAQLSIPAAVVPTTDYTESFAQLRASIDQIRLEHVQTRNDVDDLKAVLS